MTEWRETTLADACERVDYGYTASASDDPELPRFLRITDIVGPHIDWSKVPGCAIDSTKLKKYAVDDGDIVVARTGATVGYAKRIRNHPTAVFASYLVRFRAREGVVPAFLGAVVESQSYKTWVQQNAGGAAQPNANAKLLGAFPLHLPDEGTQRRIGLLLDALADLIENNRRRVEVLEEMARAIYREWFVHFRYPGHESVALADSSIGPIPEGWRPDRLDRVAKVNRASRMPADGETVEYLDISVLGDRSVGKLTTINGADAPGRARRIVSAGDVVWAMVRPNRNTRDFRCLGCSVGLPALCPVPVFESVFVVAVIVRGHCFLPAYRGGVARGSTVRGPWGQFPPS